MIYKGKYKDCEFQTVLEGDESYMYWVYHSNTKVVIGDADKKILAEKFGNEPRFYLKFGKHKGSELSQIVDTRYLLWLLDNEVITDPLFKERLIALKVIETTPEASSC